MKKEPQAVLRSMLKRDLAAVLEIERQVFEFPWQEDDFHRCLQHKDTCGAVFDTPDDNNRRLVVGFMVYELHPRRIHLLSLAVATRYQRSGIGQLMVEYLQTRLSMERRAQIMLEIRESNHDAQAFFRAHGFKATGVLRDFYQESLEDGFQFTYRLNQKPRKAG